MKKTIKKLFLLCLFSMISIGASAYDFSAVNADGVEIYYNIASSTDLTCEVTSITNGYSGTVNIPASVSCSGKTYSVTSIGNKAFTGCKGLKSVTIPNSVTSIGYMAFYNCEGLTSITIGNSVTSIGERAFVDCEGLTSVTIPNSVTSIGKDAFGSCSYLTSVTIGNSVTDIGDSAFESCTGLSSIVVDKANKVYDSRNNCNAIIETSSNELITGCKATIIPNSVTSIGNSAFKDCSGLKSIEIPNSVTSIGWHAFYNCTGLTSVTIPNSVTSIGDDAFYKCTGLTSVTIPNSVTSIGYDAFAYCTGLTSVTIPNSVTRIWGYAFNGCSDLTSIVVDKANKVYDSRNNCNAIIVTSSNELITGCKATIIPNSVTSIGNSAFKDCSGLKSIEIPNSVTSIGAGAFSGCSGLTSVTIGSSVKSIRIEAFWECNELISVTNLATKPQTLYKQDGRSAFSFYGTLHVIKGYKDVYANADYWKYFTIVDDVDPAMGIENIGLSPVLSTRDGATYNLQGVKVSGPQNRGIVIKNGKKYVVK